MKILGLVGSPRKEKGRTYEVVSRVLEGAAEKQAEVELIFLADKNLEPCIHCDFDCFSELQCKQNKGSKVFFEQIGEADGLVLGAPVYIWQSNSLTISFIEKMRLRCGPWDRDIDNHRSALGIAVAGGTGTGVFPALKSLYAFFNLWKFNPLKPLPVTRFNFNSALRTAEENGKKMGNNKIKNISRTAEIMAYYDELKFLNYTGMDEFRWLAEKIIENLESNNQGSPKRLKKYKDQINLGNSLLEKDSRIEAVQEFMSVYKKSRKLWEEKN